MKAFIKGIVFGLMRLSSLGRTIVETRETQTPVRLWMWFFQKILGFNRQTPWPVHFTSLVQNPEKIEIGVETSPGYMPGCYIQGLGGIKIGDYTQFGPHVGLISINHDFHNNRDQGDKKGIKIGAYCWFGMNSVVLAGVQLGDFTMVAAGAVVSKSFPNGHCVLAGVPAKVVKELDPQKCKRHRSSFEYCGYQTKESYLSKVKS